MKIFIELKNYGLEGDVVDVFFEIFQLSGNLYIFVKSFLYETYI